LSRTHGCCNGDALVSRRKLSKLLVFGNGMGHVPVNPFAISPESTAWKAFGAVLRVAGAGREKHSGAKQQSDWAQAGKTGKSNNVSIRRA
ncbi:hypothetical protein QVM39_32805, partial [Pseudomonas aeruginosa]|uniref:hypothetical protein n=1 Tax=Pseudomonas aeruginosa TaxID=287 RepID=UPI0035249E29